MATISTLTYEVPAAPSSWEASSSQATSISRKRRLPSTFLSRSHTFNPAPEPRTLLPVGSAYIAHARRTIHKRTLEQDFAELEEQQRKLEEARANEALNGEDDLGVSDEQESPELLARDAKEWKVS